MSRPDRFAAVRKAATPAEPIASLPARPSRAALAAVDALRTLLTMAIAVEEIRRRHRQLSATIAEDHGLPKHWADALASLRLVPRPMAAEPGRWMQIVDDAEWFALSWHGAADAHGWDLSDFFGCDLDDRTGCLGLVIEIRGGRVELLDSTSAIIRRGERRAIFRRGTAARARPIWMLRGRG